jgi:23S rRNA (cytidine1920-2'-O)/16S rRNA (cytidine1409-2'-O)-methyltransferase
MPEQEKKRLDAVVAKHHPSLSRNQIQEFISEGKVTVDARVITRPGVKILVDAVIELKADPPKYVSRAGFKLEAALEHFKVDVSNLVVLDAGISTGGFTDCLLQNGAKKVYGVDVGEGQVNEKIAGDTRVELLENTNVRHLEKLPEKVDLVTLDLSFISLLKVMPSVKKLLKSDGKIIALIKPQFEVEREDIRRGGVVEDPAVHQRVLEKVEKEMTELGFTMVGHIESPIVGQASGNIEFLGYFVQKTS